jgi:hypothetical protein
MKLASDGSQEPDSTVPREEKNLSVTTLQVQIHKQLTDVEFPYLTRQRYGFLRKYSRDVRVGRNRINDNDGERLLVSLKRRTRHLNLSMDCNSHITRSSQVHNTRE